MSASPEVSEAAAKEISEEQNRIEVGRKLSNFVLDPDIQHAIAVLGTQYYSDFKKAKTDDELRMAKAQSSVLDGFLAQLQIGIDRGEAATLQKTSRERREARSPKRPS